MVNGVCQRTEEGTPQGGPLSPLLANILLDDLDKERKKRGLQFARYADDCNILVASKRAGERVMESVIRFVEGKLKLKVKRDKSAVDRPWNRKFLGFSFLPDKQATIRLAPKTISRFKDRIREMTSRSRAISMEERIKRLNRYIIGWVRYFRLASMKTHCERFDQWIRRRLRMCLWKQWKRVRTRLRELRALGVPEWACFMMANSRMGNVPEHKQCPSDFLLGSERAEEYAFSLYGTSSTFWNRLVRTRMLGGVRGRGLAAPSYSIAF